MCVIIWLMKEEMGYLLEWEIESMVCEITTKRMREFTCNMIKIVGSIIVIKVFEGFDGSIFGRVLCCLVVTEKERKEA